MGVKGLMLEKLNSGLHSLQMFVCTCSDAHHLTVKRVKFRPRPGRVEDSAKERSSDMLQLASCGLDHCVRVYNIDTSECNNTWDIFSRNSIIQPIIEIFDFMNRFPLIQICVVRLFYTKPLLLFDKPTIIWPQFFCIRMVG